MTMAVEDYLFPSDNIFEIPCLRSDMQAGHLILPFAPYGCGRKTKEAKTLHFYVDDYRFSALWKNPAKLLNGDLKNIIELNYSIFDTTPLALGLRKLYLKRWISRYLQECGISIYVDLNVSPKFYEYNLLGVPEGFNAFATRGVRGYECNVESEYNIAKRISGLDKPNLIVYGGGESIRDFCIRKSLTYIPDFMTSKKINNG